MALSASAHGETLTTALVSAYESNAGLRGLKAQLLAADEGVVQARAQKLPRLDVTGSAGWLSESTMAYNPAGPAQPDNSRYVQRQWQLRLVQPVYSGGGIQAGIDKGLADQSAQRAALESGVQTLLLNAATAYAEVLRTTADLEGAEQMMSAIELQRHTTAVGLARRDATVVDLDQTLGRLEDARALKAQATAALAVAKAAFERWVGRPPVDLQAIGARVDLPPDKQTSVVLALESNPSIRQATFAEASARADIAASKAKVRPSVNFQAHLGNEVDQLGSSRGRSREYGLGFQIVIPLYLGGAVSANLRAEQESLRQRQIQLEQAVNLVTQKASQAWDDRATARTALEASRMQNEAAEVALRGLVFEQQRGLRTLLDVLNGRQEIWKAVTAKNRALRDVAVAEYSLLSALGRLTPEHISGALIQPSVSLPRQ
ncbi:TolC family protein [Ottowia thiooxydans]|uniref:TolC family protein n=1 Tax=Ottowia thiooxydans TaxID=219182 RepID=UPI00041E3309|nr:TolC family protein [Ottowia thiooxydans]